MNMDTTPNGDPKVLDVQGGDNISAM